MDHRASPRPYLYEMAVQKLGWNNPRKPLLQLHPDPRWLTIALMMARELGDLTTETRLRRLAEDTFEPKYFGAEEERFAWWFKLGEEWPRGQLSSLMMLSELGEPGAWSRVFNRPNLAKFSEPTVSAVDYPTVGLAQCWNDCEAGALWVETYCATPSRCGVPTTFQVSGLPDVGAIRVTLDGSEFNGWSATGTGSIEIRSDVDTHCFRIDTEFHGSSARTTSSANALPQADLIRPPAVLALATLASANAFVVSSAGGGCNCC